MKFNLVPKLLTLCSSAVLIVGIPTFAYAKTPVTQNNQQSVTLTSNSNSSLVTTDSENSAVSIPTPPVITNQPGAITSQNATNYSISGTGTPGDIVHVTLTVYGKLIM